MPDLVFTLCGREVVTSLGPIETIGRGRANTILLADESISVDHVALELRGGHVVLFDLGSSQGTYIGRDRNRGEAWTLEDGTSSCSGT